MWWKSAAVAAFQLHHLLAKDRVPSYLIVVWWFIVDDDVHLIKLCGQIVEDVSECSCSVGRPRVFEPLLRLIQPQIAFVLISILSILLLEYYSLYQDRSSKGIHIVAFTSLEKVIQFETSDVEMRFLIPRTEEVKGRWRFPKMAGQCPWMISKPSSLLACFVLVLGFG